MKLIPLTQGLSAQVDDADFDYLNQWKWCAIKSDRTYYATRCITLPNGKQTMLQMHRVILGLTDPKIKTDHVNHNGLDNQRHNIRPATHAQNMMNKSSMKNSTSQYLGVYWHSRVGKWAAQLRINKKALHLGYFKREDHAALEYNAAATKHFGDRANLNVVQDNGLFQRLRSY